MNGTGRDSDATATPVVMERRWSDSDVEEKVQGCVAAWNESEKPKGFESSLVGLGILVFLCIPFIGWIVGPIMILAAFSDGKTGDQRDQQTAERVEQIRKEMQNCYRDVACPKCGCSLIKDGDEFFVFLSDPEGLDCRICDSRLVRQGDTLTVFEGKPVAVGSS